ncbi:MAG: hypothetical protein KDA41_14940, partial [Planctomycetales bacterium]|nr:hypothetical protein [Planctomycetales bacterium]
MSRRAVEVVAPSRLHLGMFSFGHTQRRRYGGVGLMVDRPGIVLRVLPAPSFSAVGPLAERAADFAARWARSRVRADQPACRLEIVSAPPEHAGLGVGTQLGMAVAAALDSLFQLEPLPLDETARLMGRGRRSAIGVYGFQLG